MLARQSTVQSRGSEVVQKLSVGPTGGESADIGGTIQDKPVGPIFPPGGWLRMSIGAKDPVDVDVGELEARGKHPW